jgi:heat shock protein HslJ
MMSSRAIALIAVAALCSAAAPEAFAQRKEPPRPPTSSDTPVPQRQDKTFPLGVNWVAVSLNGKALGGGERPSFQLDQNLRAKGFGGCNVFSATAYPLRQQGLVVGPFALTKKACDKALLDQERAFLTALRAAQKWDLEGGFLVVKGQAGELRFERVL